MSDVEERKRDWSGAFMPGMWPRVMVFYVIVTIVEVDWNGISLFSGRRGMRHAMMGKEAFVERVGFSGGAEQTYMQVQANQERKKRNHFVYLDAIFRDVTW